MIRKDLFIFSSWDRGFGEGVKRPENAGLGGMVIEGSMLEDLYLLATIGRYRVAKSSESTPHMVRGRLMPELRRWGGKWLEGVTVSGSYAKGTAIRGVSLAPSDLDVDLFLSLSTEMSEPLAEMQRKLCGALREYQARIANVAVRIVFENRKVDLVVGRRWEGGEDHSLWRAREGTWARTNVVEQVRYVRESGCRDEILALKIWRRGQGLYFPSYCLELAVIEALAGSAGDAGLGARVLRVLGWLASELPGAELRDPANRSNVVSELMTVSERWRVSHAAWAAGRAAAWSEVI